MRGRTPLAAIVLLLAATTASADHLTLKDGRVYEGLAIRKDGEALLVEFPNGTVRVARDLVQDFFIEGEEPEPQTEEEKENRAKGLVPWKGKWVRVEQRDREREKERQARIAELEEWKKHSDWKDRYQFKTRNFQFESTLPMNLNDQYSELMETYFSEFAKKWKTRVPQDWGRLTICFHSDADSFRRVSGASDFTLGYYRFVAPRELHFYFDRGNPSLTVDVMFHEANHYLTDLMDESFQYPHWLNEAMAEYYGASEWDPAKKTMTVGGIQAGRLNEVQVDIAADKRPVLDELLSDESRDYSHYTWGWTFVHFMMESSKYSKKFQKFFNDLARAPDVERKAGAWNFKYASGAEVRRVFLSRMGMKESELPKLQGEWYEHISSLRTDGIAGIEEAGIRACYQGNGKFRGRRLLKEAIDKGSVRPDVFINYAALVGRYDGGPQAALDVLEKASERIPLEAEIWANRGYILKGLGRQAEGDKFIALAKDIDPDIDLIRLEVRFALASALKDLGEK